MSALSVRPRSDRARGPLGAGIFGPVAVHFGSIRDGQARELIAGKLTHKVGVLTAAARGGQCPAISRLPGSRAGSENRQRR